MKRWVNDAIHKIDILRIILNIISQFPYEYFFKKAVHAYPYTSRIFHPSYRGMHIDSYKDLCIQNGIDIRTMGATCAFILSALRYAFSIDIFSKVDLHGLLRKEGYYIELPVGEPCYYDLDIPTFTTLVCNYMEGYTFVTPIPITLQMTTQEVAGLLSITNCDKSLNSILEQGKHEIFTYIDTKKENWALFESAIICTITFEDIEKILEKEINRVKQKRKATR